MLCRCTALLQQWNASRQSPVGGGTFRARLRQRETACWRGWSGSARRLQRYRAGADQPWSAPGPPQAAILAGNCYQAVRHRQAGRASRSRSRPGNVLCWRPLAKDRMDGSSARSEPAGPDPDRAVLRLTFELSLYSKDSFMEQEDVLVEVCGAVSFLDRIDRRRRRPTRRVLGQSRCLTAPSRAGRTGRKPARRETFLAGVKKSKWLYTRLRGGFMDFTLLLLLLWTQEMAVQASL